eukprot:7066340-Alexandrium_andersonii.AAC.1
MADRTRSPPRGVKEDKKEEEEKKEKEEVVNTDEPDAKKQKSDQNWTEEEWAKWRKDQDEWRARRHCLDDMWGNWRREQEKEKTHEKEAQGEVNIKHDMMLKKMEAELNKGLGELNDVREATAILAQWQKKDQKDEADRQLKLTGWRGENRAQRRQAVE